MANKVATQLSSKFTELPPWAKGVISVGLFVGGAYLLYKLLKKASPENLRLAQEAEQVSQELEKSKKYYPLSYPVSMYNSLANGIQQAGFDVGTDEDAIYSAFRKLKNNTDILQLLDSWGKPTRTIYDWGVGREMTLSQFLKSELSDSEINKINYILKSKKINFEF